MDDVFLFFIGFLTGIVSSFLGVGGGIIIVPLLPLVMDLSQREVIATSLCTVFLIVFMNTVSFHLKGLIQWKLALFFGVIASLGAYLGGSFTAYVDSLFMKGVLLGVLNLLAFSFLFQDSYPKVWRNLSFIKKYALGFGVGFFGGLISGFTGIGVGSLITSFFIQFGLMQGKKVVPTSHAIVMMTSFFGALSFAGPVKEQGDVGFSSFWKLGLIRLDIFLLLSGGALLASFIGRHFQHKMPSQLRKRVLLSILIVMGVKVFISLRQ